MSAVALRRIDAAFAAMPGDSGVVERAVASGAPVAAIEALSQSWNHLDDESRGLIRDPLARTSDAVVHWGRVTAVQVDSTACGAAVAAMMTMIADPFVAGWVGAGQRASWFTPAEVAAVKARTESAQLSTIGDRWDGLQRVMQARARSHGLGVFPWVRAWGTPPWRVKAMVRFASVHFRSAIVDDSRGDERDGLVTQVRAAVADGIPVPLFVGGDSRRGLRTVVPRHVVLVVAADGENFRVYEPSAGALGTWQPYRAGYPAQQALGGWNRVMWAVLPSWRRDCVPH